MRATSREPPLAAAEPLVFRRLTLEPATTEMEALPVLGGRWVGTELPLSPSHRFGSGPLQMPLLSSGGAVLDAWSTGAETTLYEQGCVRYATDGHWLHGCAEIDDAHCDGGLQAAAHRVYADIFAVLAGSSCHHLVRIWNYFAGINRASGIEGVERYRQFNVGRHQAFIAAHRDVLDGSPAACALGTHGGPLRVYFLAGRHPPLPIENPRQVSAYRYPAVYGPRSPTFSRGALVDVGGARTALFISGTASIVGHASVHIGDVARQAEESLMNIAAVREVASARAGAAFPADALAYTVYLRRADDLSHVREVVGRAIGVDSNAARDIVYLQADICRDDLLVEIEAHGFAHTGSAP